MHFNVYIYILLCTSYMCVYFNSSKTTQHVNKYRSRMPIDLFLKYYLKYYSLCKTNTKYSTSCFLN